MGTGLVLGGLLAGLGFADHGLKPIDATLIVTVLLSVLIGGVTFSGSFVAFGKLNGRISGNPVSFPGMRLLTALLALASVAAFAYPLVMLRDSAYHAEFLSLAVVILVATSLLMGILLVIPIGGADMPVVVSLLNSYSGLAAAATGFVLHNYALIVSGALVGASFLSLVWADDRARDREIDGDVQPTVDARTIHEQASSREGPQFTVNCWAISLTSVDTASSVPVACCVDSSRLSVATMASNASQLRAARPETRGGPRWDP